MSIIDLFYRPGTYWPASLTREQLLARISGQARRQLVRSALAGEGPGSIDPVLAGAELDAANRRSWGLADPTLMGGEYLPSLGETDVEIARISLQSVTADQISIRASDTGEHIRYAVCDEYGTEFRLSITESDLPLTLGELIALVDGGGHASDELSGGLLVPHWENMLEWEHSLEEAVAFASIDSAWYPQLGEYYEWVAEDWCERKRAELGIDEEECA